MKVLLPDNDLIVRMYHIWAIRQCLPRRVTTTGCTRIDPRKEEGRKEEEEVDNYCPKHLVTRCAGFVALGYSMYLPRSAYGTMVQTPYAMAWGLSSYSLQIYDNRGFHQSRYGFISLVSSARIIWFWSMLRLGFLI